MHKPNRVTKKARGDNLEIPDGIFHSKKNREGGDNPDWTQLPHDVLVRVMGFLLSGGTKPHQSPYVNFIAAAHVCYTWNASCKTIFFSWGGNKEFFKRVEGLQVRRGTHVLRERHRQKIRSLFDIPCRCIRFPSTILTPDKNKCGPFCSVFPSYSTI